MIRVAKLQLAIVVALAVGLRWHEIGQLSLNHFDEGVFVSGAFGVWLNGPWHFPLAQPLQAPPLFPWMIAGTFALTQTTWPIMGIYLSAALGSVTVVVYFALLRRLYGDTFALVGAGLLAASDLHIAFSRMALTDVPLTFWFVVGAYALVRLVEAARPVAQTENGAARRRVVGWALAFGLAAGAAWNTKYNGWMLVAIAATAWAMVWARQRLFARTGSHNADTGDDNTFARVFVLLAIGLAALVAIGCFTPWYVHVERTYRDGYRAVTANHLKYVGGIADWPSRAARLWQSLAAFRHYGWLATVIALASAAGWHSARRLFPRLLIEHKGPARKDERQTSLALWVRADASTLIVAIAFLSAAVVLGSDAVMIVIAAAAIGPALVFGRWPEVLFAVWTGAFLLLTPFYHPYTRLLVPALPAVIALAVWLVSAALRGRQPETEARGSAGEVPRAADSKPAWTMLALVCVGVCVTALIWQPFGWLPSRGAWERWSSRESYRALGDAVLEAKVPTDAVVLCQGSPAMTLYVLREWAPLEIVPFDLWLTHVERGRECYLAVDFWGIYGENHQLALKTILERIDYLEPIAVVNNDLNLPTLLDYLSAAEVAGHVSQSWPTKQIVDSQGRAVAVPAPLDERHADLIVLYRIDRNRLDLLDKTHQPALE